MNITLVTPAVSGSRAGNRVTAVRWARILRSLGHHVRILDAYQGERCDLLIALHALRSFPSVQRYRAERPEAPLVVALTGTDVYGSIHTSTDARLSLKLATRLVVLQPLAVNELPKAARTKARVIIQSMPSPRTTPAPRSHSFDICVLGHLRPVKDPFRAARAARLLPPASRIQIVHLGKALSAAMATTARKEETVNPRYHWLGDVPRWQALRTLARSRLLVLTSKLEGGANVISEALAASVPVVSSRIAGSIGLLGADYPGYFPVGETRALAALLRRAEVDTAFYETLKRRCVQLRSLVDPHLERQRWQELVDEL